MKKNERYRLNQDPNLWGALELREREGRVGKISLEKSIGIQEHLRKVSGD